MLGIECVGLSMNFRSVGFFWWLSNGMIGRIERGSYGGKWPMVVVGH